MRVVAIYMSKRTVCCGLMSSVSKRGTSGFSFSVRRNCATSLNVPKMRVCAGCLLWQDLYSKWR